MAFMELREVTKSYQQGSRTVHAVRGVSLEVAQAEFVSIMGPSGSGKSTLLHLLGTLDTPSTGGAFFQDRNLTNLTDKERSILRRTKIGFVFQFFNLLPTLRSDENVALPLLLGNVKRSLAMDLAAKSLERVGMSHRADHFPDAMSGGEMQRVAIARALVTNPQAVLCDEPTGNLDSVTSREILSLLRSLPDDQGCSVVMVTHDRTAAEYGDRLIHIQDGRIAREERFRPQTGQPSVPALAN